MVLYLKKQPGVNLKKTSNHIHNQEKGVSETENF